MATLAAHRRRAATATAASLLLVLACSALAQGTAPHVHSGPKPARSGVAGFDIYRDGQVLHLLAAEANPEGQKQLLYRRSKDHGRSWTQAVTVQGSDGALHEIVRGNDPQIAAHGDLILAVWTAKGTGYGGSGPLVTALSRDGGRSWMRASNPADTNSTAGHGYVDVIAEARGFDLVWLDGRDGAQGLRHAHSRDGVNWSRNVTIQKATCECCWNTLARRRSDLLVMVRGKDPRDMLLFARGREGDWRRTATVGAFGWDFKGCPHTGGGLATADVAAGLLHAVVWTGASGEQGLHYLKSSDGGSSWSAPHRVGSVDARRGDIAAGSGGAVLVAWDQFESAGAGERPRNAIYVMESRDGGQRWWKPARMSTTGADANYPRVVPTGEGFLVLWTEATADGASLLKMQPFPSSR